MPELETPANGETPSAQPPVTPPAATPPVANASDGEVERLRKELEQKTMRENQLANELKKRDEAAEAARQAELEQQNEFKTLYEQERARAKALEDEREQADREKTLAAAKAQVLAEYPDEVKQLASDLGIDVLADDSDASKAALKEKLDKLNVSNNATGSIAPNNPNVITPPTVLDADAVRAVSHDDGAFHELMVKNFPGIAAMTKQQ